MARITPSALKRLLARFSWVFRSRSTMDDGKQPIDPAWLPLDLSRVPVDNLF